MSNRSESPTWTLNNTLDARLDTIIGPHSPRNTWFFGRVNLVYFFCKLRGLTLVRDAFLKPKVSSEVSKQAASLLSALTTLAAKLLYA